MQGQEEYIAKVIGDFQKLTDDLIKRIRENDELTVKLWKEKNDEKLDLLVARRLVRLEMIIEARRGENITEVRTFEGIKQVAAKTAFELEDAEHQARRRASDPEEFNTLMFNSIADFEAAGLDNIKNLLRAEQQERDIMYLHLITENQKFAEQLLTAAKVDLDKMIADFELKRESRLAKLHAKRVKSIEEIFKVNADANLQVLKGIDDLSLDYLDNACMAGLGLEDYCFDP